MGETAPKDLTVRRVGACIDEVAADEGVSRLVAQGDGTECIQHRLASGGLFGFVPQRGWTAFEAVTVLSGRLVCVSHAIAPLGPGDTVSAWPVRHSYLFQALEPTVLLHVSSQPAFAQTAGAAVPEWSNLEGPFDRFVAVPEAFAS